VITEPHLPDVVIVGAGHNALVAAFYLARAGLTVECFEAKDSIGGACKTEELIPGYRFSTCASILAFLRPRIRRDMKLSERGLTVLPLVGTAVTEGGRGSTGDATPPGPVAEPGSGQQTWSALWADAVRLLGPYLLSYPPTIAELRERASRIGVSDVLETLLATPYGALVTRMLGERYARDSIIPPFDVTSFDSPGSSLLTAISLAISSYSETGDPVESGFVAGGMGEVTRLMAQAAEAEGARIRTNAPVRRVLTEGASAVGVELEDGTRVNARVVLSGTDVRRTFGRLLDGVDAVQDTADRVRELSARVAPLKLHVALSGLPTFGGSLTDNYFINIGRRAFDDAWDDAARGRLPRDPYMHLMIPSIADPSIAPPGHHTLSVWSLYAPIEPAESSWPERREEMADRMMEIIAEHSPDFASMVVDRLLLTPYDIEERVLLTGGQVHHIDMIPEQMLASRPLPELARYRAPLEGLYLGGAGQHPYGEVTGAPGHNAAHAILEDLDLIDGSWQEIARVGTSS
jgi:phytoene dehydrogenase-like protein